MFCPNCGSQTEAGTICANCGAFVQGSEPQQAAPPPAPYPPQQPYQQQPYQQPYGQPAYGAQPNVDDQPSTILNLLGCCIPMAGLIMYLIMKDQTPNKAKAIGKWTIIGLISGFVLGIVYAILMVAGVFAFSSLGLPNDFFSEFAAAFFLR